MLNTPEHQGVAYRLRRAQIASAYVHFPMGFGCPRPLHTGSKTAFETPMSSTGLSLGLFAALLMISWEKNTQNQEKGFSNAKSPNALIEQVMSLLLGLQKLPSLLLCAQYGWTLRCVGEERQGFGRVGFIAFQFKVSFLIG